MFCRILTILIASLAVGNMTEAQPMKAPSAPAAPCGDHISQRPHPQLILNQRTGEVCFVSVKSVSRRIGPDSKLRIREKELEIRVVHTLTPFNVYSLNEAPMRPVTPAPDYGSREAMGASLVEVPGSSIRPFLPAKERDRGSRMHENEIRHLVTDLHLRSQERIPELLRRTERLLIRNSAGDVYGLQELRMRVIVALSDMAASQYADPSGHTALRIRDTLRSDLAPSFRPDSGGLKLTRELVEAYRQLSRETEALQRVAEQLAQVGELSPTDSLRTHQRLTEAGHHLARAGETLAAVHTVEEATLTAMDTEAEWSRIISVSRFKSRSVHLRVEPQAVSGVASPAQEQILDASLKRESIVRPSLGLTLLYANQATYASEFGVELRNGTSMVVETDQRDDRTNWALTLGLTPYFLDWNEWAITPQFHLTPTGNVKAFGIGGAVGYSFLHFSVGALWTKHKVLTDLETGDVVLPGTELKTEDTYGSPRLFFGISVRGIPPFVR